MQNEVYFQFQGIAPSPSNESTHRRIRRRKWPPPRKREIGTIVNESELDSISEVKDNSEESDYEILRAAIEDGKYKYQNGEKISNRFRFATAIPTSPANLVENVEFIDGKRNDSLEINANIGSLEEVNFERITSSKNKKRVQFLGLGKESQSFSPDIEQSYSLSQSRMKSPIGPIENNSTIEIQFHQVKENFIEIFSKQPLVDEVNKTL